MIQNMYYRKHLQIADCITFRCKTIKKYKMTFNKKFRKLKLLIQNTALSAYKSRK